jgi:NAD(P) transhydrogenase subunit beta
MSTLISLVYTGAAVLFIYGLRLLGSPATARKGNLVSGLGMLLAIVVTLLDRQIITFPVIFAGLIVGGAIGFWMATAVKMTSMPQMVALLNGFGGAASLLVGSAEFLRAYGAFEALPVPAGIATQLSIIIGAVTLTGSILAFAKLQELMTGKPITFAGQKFINGAIALAIVGFAVWQIVVPSPLIGPYWVVVIAALLIGVGLVLPIGGADMPVVISLLNSYSGIAAAMTGFVIQNPILIVAGALVGSSGIILSQIMCRAMNRSLANVIFGAFGSTAAASTRSAEGLTVKSVSVEDAAVQLAYAQLVIVVPGYGLAVAQAQHQVRELAELIEKRGGEVRYAIHPVAGRMPGHMNVLLAEANVPYDKLYEMEQINDEFQRADVALVIGANDVVNPAARTDTASPIYGMPILNADLAKSCIVMKRGMSAGFAGIENDLFYKERTSMLFGDAKGSLTKLVAEVKAI